MLQRLMVTAAVLAASLGAAAAADLRMPVKAPPPVVDPPFSWAGFYLGGNIGYSWGSGRTDLSETQTNTAVLTNLIGGIGGTAGPGNGTTTSTTTTVSGSGRANIDGVVGGAQIGNNWQVDRWVFGLEGDIQGTGQRGDTSLCLTAGCPNGSPFGSASYRMPWFATVRGRVGLAFDRVLFYATGGLAVAGINASYVDGTTGAAGVAFPGNANTTRVGSVVGGGIEGAIDRNWTVKVEYLYMDFGRINALVTGSSTTTTVLRNTSDFFTAVAATQALGSAFSTRVTDNVVRIGFNYKFDPPGAAPVTARY